MAAAIARLRRALALGERIAVYGDFDVDGVTATSILSEGLRALGAEVIPFIPNRFRDGYGVSTPALSRLAKQDVRLAITVDCGSSAITEAEHAKSLGLDLIIVDHHEVGSILPPAAAVVNPKRPSSSYPTHDLCSGALAFRLLEALYLTLERPLDRARYLDLVALATVCDMVPLQGENRDLVKEGLPAVAATHRPGLRALLQAAAVDGAPPDAETLGYRVGPRLNAAGRLDDASIALEILMTNDAKRAAGLASQLTDLNRRRQQMVDEALRIAFELAEGEPGGAPVLVVGHASISRGIVGLVASRLAETYGRPAFVYEECPDGCVGSARGVPGFDVVLALDGAKELLTRHGGHRAAGGFALPISHIEEFRERLRQAAVEQLRDRSPEQSIEIDATEPLRGLSRPILTYLERFAPCGIGNPAPVIQSREVTVVGSRAIAEGRHLMLDLRDGPATWRAFAFGRGSEVVGLGTRIDIVYSVEKGSRGYGPRLRLVDWRKSRPMGAEP